MGNRQVDRVSNTSRACTSVRHIVEQSFVRANNMKLSGNKYPVSHHLTNAAGVQPTPHLPGISIWHDVMCVLRRRMTPYYLKYELAPGVTYSDHGQDLRDRLPKENVLCSTKSLVFNRPDPYALVRAPELNNGSVIRANLLDPNQTRLPAWTEAVLMGYTLGPGPVKSARGYLTDIQEKAVMAYLNQGNYHDPDQFHQLAAQVSKGFKRGGGGDFLFVCLTLFWYLFQALSYHHCEDHNTIDSSI